jgi:hypothetical protein
LPIPQISVMSPFPLRSSHAPIEHMENRSPRRDSRDSGHGQNLTKAAHPCQYMRLSPLILPFNPPL